LLTLEELDHEDDYKRLVKAVIDSGIVDYVKLAHPKNRNKKYLTQCYLNAVDMFFDDNYKLKAFVSFLDETPFTTRELISILLSTPGVSMPKARQHVIDQSNEYWWKKHFNDIPLPSSISIFGKTYFLHTASTTHIDYQKNQIFLPLKDVNADRIFFKLCLEIILREADISLDEKTFNKLHKIFYLFLKVNNAF
jgi:hypothetical protein